MKLTITIDIPEDFKLLYDIFNLEPEHIIQAFANKISFPGFYSKPNSEYRWANFFILDYLSTLNRRDEIKWDVHKPYMDRMVHSLSGNGEESERASRAVMKEWRQFILNKRTEDLITRLRAEEKD